MRLFSILTLSVSSFPVEKCAIDYMDNYIINLVHFFSLLMVSHPPPHPKRGGGGHLWVLFSNLNSYSSLNTLDDL